MKIEEQYKNLLEIKKEINIRLQNLDFYKIKDLILWLTKSEIYQKLKSKDNQLIALDIFVSIWLQEKQNMDAFEMQGDIFYGVSSLEEVESKYLDAKFLVFRIENGVPYEYCLEGVRKVLQARFSAYALYVIILRESYLREKNILALARLFKAENELVKTIGLLQKALEKYETNEEMLLELADCWIMSGQWQKAYECLEKIENPNDEITELVNELKKVRQDENV